ncbi:PhzF family phenazine biosynthesis protein [Sphingomonas prati]|uniref:PhzF family phenazine biosynthesis protein n=1 Tax=Sphingomonas prati TaxID=1843237 RepID=A0A7W9BVT1_9SPHN|nr:PhzF family phenazine biosynthesis protein [Sphingomonas prati]MBB5730538.1 PhzF family phenazine biosynthesis protein [Sphingomonas prati]GGE94819.1 phenazine biosynthesis protein PhzF [Sphingomonas prati]
MTRSFHLVDVFGTDRFTGNPLAVVADAEGLSTEEMQTITRWLNLSETAFLLPPTEAGADYRVRIFTLAHELPFAGHPTLGSAHAWLEAGGKPRQDGVVVQECAAGLIPIRRDGDRLAFAAPPLLRGGVPSEAEIAEVATVLRIEPNAIVDAAWVDNGPGWIAVMLASADAVLALEPARHHDGQIDIGIVGPHAPGGETAFELRAIFSDAYGALIEDPVTGSLNASVGQWLFASDRATGAYVAAQGTRLGRTGRIHVEQDGAGQVWVGGATRTLFSGRSKD